jgi:hypothetical protein
MKLYTALSLVGLGLGVVGIVSAQGCGSDSSSGGGNTADAGQTAKGRQPPAKPDAPATTSSDERTFAVYSLSLGEADRNGVANKDAWKDYGFDLDGLTTTKDSKDVCQRQQGASASNQEDGKDGIDNAFGKVIIPFLAPFAAAPSKTLTDSIHSGSFTILLKIKGLTDDPTQTNTGLSGTLLVGANYGEGKTPTFTETDNWPFRKDPQVPITDAYINNGTFVNGAGGSTVKLSLYIQGVSLDLAINKAIITFDHSAPNEATNGTIAGVIGTEELVSGIEKVAGRISTQLCGGSTLDSIKQTIRQASDILKDGTNKAGVPCDAISIGIGFTAKRIGNPTTEAPPDKTPPDPCTNPPDGGTDSGSDASDASQD